MDLGYYCAPLGEVLRSMLHWLRNRSGKSYSLTDAVGCIATAVDSTEAEDTVNQVMQMLAARSLTASYIKKKIPLADRILKSLERKAGSRRKRFSMTGSAARTRGEAANHIEQPINGRASARQTT